MHQLPSVEGESYRMFPLRQVKPASHTFSNSSSCCCITFKGNHYLPSSTYSTCSHRHPPTVGLVSLWLTEERVTQHLLPRMQGQICSLHSWSWMSSLWIEHENAKCFSVPLLSSYRIYRGGCLKKKKFLDLSVKLVVLCSIAFFLADALASGPVFYWLLFRLHGPSGVPLSLSI